jgi:NAD(P)-dependent dehydrogenase (short-subunit alcohol dehydrogenase family)
VLADFDLTGQKALVTGAGRGIGRGIALALAEAGADVAVTGLGETNARNVAEEITRTTGRAGFGYAADGTRVQTVSALAERVFDDLKGLDILVNCLGDAIRGGVVDIDEQSWHTVIDVNLTQAYVACHVFGPHLLQQRRGSVLNVSSFAALRPGAQMVAYAAAKAGLTRFTESLALEWAPDVRVNAIAPGTFPDRQAMTDEEFQRREAQAAPGIPLRRLGNVREVGLLAVYLSSPAASYVTGQTVAIDGGRTLL